MDTKAKRDICKAQGFASLLEICHRLSWGHWQHLLFSGRAGRAVVSEGRVGEVKSCVLSASCQLIPSAQSNVSVRNSV